MPEIKEWWRHDPDTLRKGIGVVLSWKPTGWAVRRVIAESPAEASGIQPGDVLSSVNGYELAAKDDISEAFRVSLETDLEGADRHEYVFNSGGKAKKETFKAKSLRELIEAEYVKTGLMHDQCSTCYECWPTSNGWDKCGKTGCSGRCIVT